MSNQNDLRLINNIITKLDSNKVSRFSYTNKAFADDDADSVDVFNINAENNIPKDPLYDGSVLDNGLRAQGASITRDGFNHFIGRVSYNINKLIQKFKQFLDFSAAAWAHNAFEYDLSAKYAFGDVCYFIETVDGVKVFTFYQRTSQTPATISNVPPTVALHWSPMQNKTSTSALLPFKAPGYQHKYSIIDLTDGFDSGLWYPAIAAAPNFENDEGALQVLFEAYCNGPVAGLAGSYQAELAVLSRFTGFAESSTDIILDKAFINNETGAALSEFSFCPIGFSKLPKGRQAVIWLKGGATYALWNSYGSVFTLIADIYDNTLDPTIAPVMHRPFETQTGVIQARLRTPDAVNSDEAPNLGQIDGSIPLPKTLSSGSQLNSVRTPSVYVVDSDAVANSIANVPTLNPGSFTLTVKGDKNGLTATTQYFLQHSTGTEYMRTLTGGVVAVPWHIASSPEGAYVLMQGLYAFTIDAACHLILHYQDSTDIPHFYIDDDNNLIAEIN